MQTSTHQTRDIGLICLALAVVTFVLYWPVHAHEFINYDDAVYIRDNVHVIHGLNRADAKWAFSTGRSGYAHPVTWLSHQLDYQLYSSWPGGHHLTSVAIHIANTILLFFLFRRMTRATWPSAFVAAIFAIHPLHVESVAWVAERKDVLSGFFWLLTLHAYVAYTEKRYLTRYLLAMFLFALGLMSKPMIVTLPGVLLLLDYWPLRRTKFTAGHPEPSRADTLSWLIVEKLPFVIMAAAWSAVTFVVTKKLGAVVLASSFGLERRMTNALVSYAAYFWNTLWPENLALFYPYPKAWPTSVVATSFVLLAGISILCVAKRKSAPYLVVGWLWFLGTLVPVIGFIQAGLQSRADRYTYIPQIGLAMAIAWSIASLTESWRYRREILTIGATLLIVAMAACTRKQLSYWRTSETIWNHSLAVTSDNDIAHAHMGSLLAKEEHLKEAESHLTEALRINPGNDDAHNNLGIVLIKENRLEEAIAHLQKAFQLNPKNDDAHSNLGIALAKEGQPDEAVTEMQEALRINPDHAGANNNLGNISFQKGDLDKATGYFRKATEINPNHPTAYFNLGHVFARKGQLDDAIICYRRELEIRPSYADARFALAEALRRKGAFEEATTQYEQVLEQKQDYPGAREAKARSLAHDAAADDVSAPQNK